MGCKCKKGGQRTVVMSSASMSTSDMVLVRYTGSAIQKRRIKSKSHTVEYVFSGDQREFYIYPEDAQFFVNALEFEVLGSKTAASMDVSPVSVEREPKRRLMLTDLDLDPEILNRLLEAGYTEVTDIDRATDGDLLAIKGIGDARLGKIRDAIRAAGNVD